MATIGEDLRSHLTSSTLIKGVLETYKRPHVIEQNTIPTNPPSPRIWFGRARDVAESDMSGEAGVRISEWDMEIFGANDTDVTAIADAVKTRLNGLTGIMGTTRQVLGCFVDDHDDDYLLRGIGNSTEAVNVAALRLTIFTS